MFIERGPTGGVRNQSHKFEPAIRRRVATAEAGRVMKLGRFYARNENAQLPKLDVAGSIPSSRFSNQRVPTSLSRLHPMHRTHTGLDGRTPESARRQSVTFSSYCWQGHCRGLYQTPAAARLWNSPGTGCATAPASCRSKGIIIYLEGGGPRYCFRIFATIVNSGSTTFEISNSIAWPSNRLAPRSSNP